MKTAYWMIVPAMVFLQPCAAESADADAPA